MNDIQQYGRSISELLVESHTLKRTNHLCSSSRLEITSFITLKPTKHKFLHCKHTDTLYVINCRPLFNNQNPYY